MTYETMLAAVTHDPEADAPRHAFAAHVRSYDPQLARFIELQLASASERRARHEARKTVPSAEDRKLLDANLERWARTLRKYAVDIVYDRGFATKISIDPDLFLEYGDWLYTNAPIRHVAFTKPQDGAFPIDELAASPLLARLESIELTSCGLGDADIATLARSPHLDRLRYLDLSWTRLGPAAYEALAASPATRKLLVVVRSGRDIGAPLPGERFDATDQDNLAGAAVMDWIAMPPEGVALERAHGYLPWLHPRDNSCDAFDAAYYVARGELPVKAAGR
jgi:hypothetical protein